LIRGSTKINKGRFFPELPLYRNQSGESVEAENVCLRQPSRVAIRIVGLVVLRITWPWNGYLAAQGAAVSIKCEIKWAIKSTALKFKVKAKEETMECGVRNEVPHRFTDTKGLTQREQRRREGKSMNDEG